MKLFNQARKYGPRLVAAVAMPLALVPNLAHAALDAAVTTAVTDAKTDLLTLISALTVAGVAIWVGSLIYRRFKVK